MRTTPPTTRISFAINDTAEIVVSAVPAHWTGFRSFYEGSVVINNKPVYGVGVFDTINGAYQAAKEVYYLYCC